MAKYLFYNKVVITTRLKEMKKPTLAKLELEKERLYKSLDGLPLSERFERYGLISDIRLRIEKLAKFSEMINNYINIVRKLSKEFDIVLAKELFSSFVVKEIEVHLTVSFGGDEVKTVPAKENINHLSIQAKYIVQQFIYLLKTFSLI